jgi:Ohr subfamily peroxiredoxin
MKTLYTAVVTTTGGREGYVTSDDGNLDLKLSMPQELGGKGGENSNPEQLFAAAYSASYSSALKVAAKKHDLELGDYSVTATVSIGKPEEGGMVLAVIVDAYLPEANIETGEMLVNEAYEICPYSRATEDNIDVTLNLLLAEDEEE